MCILDNDVKELLVCFVVFTVSHDYYRHLHQADNLSYDSVSADLWAGPLLDVCMTDQMARRNLLNLQHLRREISVDHSQFAAVNPTTTLSRHCVSESEFEWDEMIDCGCYVNDEQMIRQNCRHIHRSRKT